MGLNKLAVENPETGNLDDNEPNPEQLEQEASLEEESIQEGVDEEEAGEELEEGTSEDELTDEERFLDPSNLPKELLPAFKRMQASFTKAMQKVASQREKIALFDKLMEDPEAAVGALAEKVGLRVSKKGAISEPHETAGEPEVTDTESWVRKIIREELTPVVEQLRQEQAEIKAKSAIAYLNETYPDWYLYEDTMAELVRRHPSLRDDLDNLYRLAKAGTERAIKTKKASSKQAEVLTKSSKGREAVTVPKKAKTIDEAFEIAKKQLGLS